MLKVCKCSFPLRDIGGAVLYLLLIRHSHVAACYTLNQTGSFNEKGGVQFDKVDSRELPLYLKCPCNAHDNETSAQEARVIDSQQQLASYMTGGK